MRALLNARILSQIKVFKNFEIAFLAEITNYFVAKQFSTDDYIVSEGEDGGTMYFIVSGHVTIVHKATQTYIKDLD